MELWRAIELAPKGIGLDDYPIFDEAHRAELNLKITRRYNSREIGFETIEQFRLAMQRRMYEIMPYYNQLYETTKIPYEALSTVNITTFSEGQDANATHLTSDENTRSNSTVESGSRQIGSSFPQTMLAGDEDYADSGTDAKSTATTDVTADNANTADTASNGTSSGTSTTTGYQGIPAELIQSFRGAILNIDLDIVENLADLFMRVWDNGDNYTRGGLY